MNYNEHHQPLNITPLSDEERRLSEWKLAVDGEVMDDIASATMTNDRMGVQVTYGRRPEGYDGFVIREPGGAATMPYTIDTDGNIYVGVVEEVRPTMGEAKTKNIPRGFSDFGETKSETAQRELNEETGYRAIGSRLIKLAGGLNPNSTYFDFSHSQDDGIDIYAIPVSREELTIHHDEDGDVFYSFPPHVQDRAEHDKTAERILGSRFIPITEAMQSRDMFTAAAAGHLVVYLLKQGEYLLPQASKPITTDPV
jgi:ADP-ribose pyrophosphatase YjhB (NUDIX family)